MRVWSPLLFTAIAMSVLQDGSAAADTKPSAGKPSKKRSVSECTSYEQRETEAGLDLEVSSTCAIPVSCSVSWTLTCHPASKKRRVRSRGQHTFSLEAGSPPPHAVSVSADSCGAADWQIANVVWRCEPKDM